MTSKQEFFLVTLFLVLVSVLAFWYFYVTGLGVAYNDARSHLNIGRRVVEGLKPGTAQLGSVWLPLLHALMIPTVWHDFMWHSGLAGALPSMISFVLTGILIWQFLFKLKTGWLGRLTGLLVFVLNLNIIYLQSTAMTELLLLWTMTAGVYAFFLWYRQEKLLFLLKAAFFIMLATLVRYDAWFLLVFVSFLIVAGLVIKRKNLSEIEGTFLFFITLAGLGVVLWLAWNWLIFKDPLYFAFGQFSAHSQQKLLESAGNLATKGNLSLSLKYYFYALVYNQGALTVFFGLLGLAMLLREKSLTLVARLSLVSLTAPFLFNVLALYLGHSVLFIQGLSGNTWFNIRYGIMMAPSIAIFVGFLVHKLVRLRPVLISLLSLVTFFSLANRDAVTIDDAVSGASQKNVTEISDWLQKNVALRQELILISAASHDAIIFSSGLPMARFIHEGTGKYWEDATRAPDTLAKWIIMRTHDANDLTYKTVSRLPAFAKYRLVKKYPFADVYELQD